MELELAGVEKCGHTGTRAGGSIGLDHGLNTPSEDGGRSPLHTTFGNLRVTTWAKGNEESPLLFLVVCASCVVVEGNAFPGGPRFIVGVLMQNHAVNGRSPETRWVGGGNGRGGIHGVRQRCSPRHTTP